MKSYVVAGEIIKIHTYLLKAPKLRYMAGGSLLLETFSRKLVPVLAEKIGAGRQKIYLHAAGRFVVDFLKEDQAERFKKLIIFVARYLFGEENVLVCGPLLKGKGIVKRIGDELEAQKTDASARPFSAMPALQFMERCGACGTWGAMHCVEIADNEPFVQLCDTCNLKLLARNDTKIEIRLPSSMQTDGLLKIVIGGSNKKRTRLVVPFAQDPYKNEKINSFSEIAAAARSDHGYIGVFYADGNEMGSLIQRPEVTETIEKYSDFSSNISKWNISALEKAADTVNVNRTDGFPGRILIRGGDDLLVVLPAESALKFARVFLEEASGDDSPFKEGICGGLVLSQPSMPFSILFSKAEELAVNAKKQMWLLKRDAKTGSDNTSRSPRQKSALDFMVVTSPLLEPLGSQPERQHYILPDGRNYAFLTARPYLVEELGELVKHIRRLKDMETPRRTFMDLKNIFYPSEITEDRIDAQGRFVKLEAMANRLDVLYSKNAKTYKGLLMQEFLEHDNWRFVDRNGIKRSAQRTWQGDIVELVDFC